MDEMHHPAARAWPMLPRLTVTIARRLPFVRGALRAALCRWLRGVVDNAPLEVDLWGLKAELSLDNTTDVKILLSPRSYMAEEIAFCRNALSRCEGTFVDVGANTGVFSLGALSGHPRCMVLAIEPNPAALQRLTRNLISLNPAIAGRVIIHQGAVGKVEGPHGFTVSGRGLGTARLSQDDDTVDFQVDTKPVADIIEMYGINRVSCMKIDIEGHEDTAMVPYFDHIPDSQLPRSVIAERPGDRAGAMERVMASRGYSQVGGTDANAFFTR